MLKKDFWYDLPKELIAQEPADPRDSARLMVLSQKDDSIQHKIFHDLPEFLEPGDLLVVNNSKVLPARIVGVKQPTGAVCELLLLRQVKGDQWECLAKPGKRMQPGTKVSFGDGSLTAVVDETMEDIEGIAETAQKVVDLYYSLPKRGKGKGVQVTISCACFVPKPHTPFEFVPMDTEEMLRAKQKHLLESVRSRKIKVNYHDSTTSFLEGVFAKGDRRLAPVIVEAYKRGCYFDGWEECFKYDTWLQTFADLGIDPAFYCQRPIGLDEVTPWSHMDYGVTHEYLVREYQKALAAQTTQPCNRACHGCGANHLLGGPCFDYSQNLV